MEISSFGSQLPWFWVIISFNCIWPQFWSYSFSFSHFDWEKDISLSSWPIHVSFKLTGSFQAFIIFYSVAGQYHNWKRIIILVWKYSESTKLFVFNPFWQSPRHKNRTHGLVFTVQVLGSNRFAVGRIIRFGAKYKSKLESPNHAFFM